MYGGRLFVLLEQAALDRVALRWYRSVAAATNMLLHALISQVSVVSIKHPIGCHRGGSFLVCNGHHGHQRKVALARSHISRHVSSKGSEFCGETRHEFETWQIIASILREVPLVSLNNSSEDCLSTAPDHVP